MARALVTGATGMVGSYMAERLLADGWSVRAIVRDPARAAWLAALGADLAPGDVLDAETFARAARGCDVILHAAAVVLPRGGWEAYRRTNLDGTAAAIGAAAGAGARLVQISSVAVYGSEARYTPGRPTDERTPLPELPVTAHYARSKRESEAMVLDAHRAGRIWATALRPDVIYGRRDRYFVPRAARVLSKGVWPVLGGGHSTLAIVHAANVADAAVRAATSDVAGGQAYNVANDYDVTVREFGLLGARGLGRRVVPLPVPVALVRLGLRAARAVLRLTHGSGAAALSSGTLGFLTRDNPFTSERARTELGWSPPVHPGTGVPDAFRWWREHHREA